MNLLACFSHCAGNAVNNQIGVGLPYAWSHALRYLIGIYGIYTTKISALCYTQDLAPCKGKEDVIKYRTTRFRSSFGSLCMISAIK